MKIGRFACPGCGQKIEASLISLASKVECPNCGEKFFPDFKIFDDETGEPVDLTEHEKLQMLKEGIESGAIKFRVKVTVEK